MQKIELRIDVSAAVPLPGRHEVAMTPLRTSASARGSLTVPPCAVTMMTPGVVAAEAAAVKAPVLIADCESSPQ